MAELPPIKKPPKQSFKWLGFLFGATIEGGGDIIHNIGRSDGCINLFYSSFCKKELM